MSREYRVVRAGDINIGDRVIAPDDADLGDLLADIRKRGLHDPILVDPNLNLIDGLRRLAAFSKDSEVDVVVSDNYLDTIEVMKLGLGKPFTRAWGTRRIWDFHVATTEQRKANHHSKQVVGAARSRPGTGRKPGAHRSVSRELVASISGRHMAVVQACLFLYMRAYGHVKVERPELQDAALKMVAEMEAGGNVYAARHYWNKVRDAGEGGITGESEQRQILRNAAASGTTLVRILTDFGPINEKITSNEAQQFLDVFMQVRTDIYPIIKKLRERTQKG